ncbi:hypothetical protein FD754_005275 [Muntiacus muntjak]|uniref:Uncharacterized protein n=1 Tax=Muntiacus muntjak TaxID=9888 RepID=A0A5N3WH92_MUNMU|nr:hypothetical protein FD754_005275 [Muntiacus muntjak]
MDLPVDEWKSYILQKWSLLPKSIQVTISTAKTLNDLFLHSSLLLHAGFSLWGSFNSSCYFHSSS